MDSAGQELQAEAQSKKPVECKTSMDKYSELKNQSSQQEFKMDAAEPEPQAQAGFKCLLKRKISMDRDVDYKQTSAVAGMSSVFSGLGSELLPLLPERAAPELQSPRRLRSQTSV